MREMPFLMDRDLYSTSYKHHPLERSKSIGERNLTSGKAVHIGYAPSKENRQPCELDGGLSVLERGAQQIEDNPRLYPVDNDGDEGFRKRKRLEQSDTPRANSTSPTKIVHSTERTMKGLFNSAKNSSTLSIPPSTNLRAMDNGHSYAYSSLGDALPGKPSKRLTVQSCATRMQRQEILKASDYRRMWPTGNSRHPLGMYNRVVDCYRIAVLQALLSNPIVNNRFAIARRAHRDSATHAENIRCLVCDLARLSEAIWSHSAEANENLKRVHVSIALQDKKRVYSWTRDRNEMADSAEFLRWLLSQIEPQLNPPVAHALFSTEEHGEWVCTMCGEISTMPPQQTSEILLEIKNLAQPDLQSALKQHFQEQLPSIRCERCKTLNKPIRKRTIAEAPEVLFLTLKRFEQVQSPRTGMVIDRKIDKPLKIYATLDLGEFTEKAMHDRGPLCYELSAVVCHLGGFDGGHYIAYIATPSGRVFRMDDDDVMAVDAKQMLKPGNGFTPYILMYRRSDNTMDADTLAEDL